MLVIKPTQFDTLRAVAELGYLQRLSALAKRFRPDVTAKLAEPLLLDFCRESAAKGRQLGFLTEADLAVFFLSVIHLGRDWHLDGKHPLHAVVHRPEADATLRATQLLYELEALHGHPQRPRQ